ncbi:MAG: tRNA lysidine(34) synthetase TilS [Clostridia bacterium]|nr:tRNA lysidine(34) synthetase TilS [Clostridia bacterium]
MICKVKSTIDRNCMLKSGDKVIVALSGGSDSMVLLDVLRVLSSVYNLELCAAHVNHQLRGEESDRDENFVRNYCFEHKIPCFVHKIDVKNSRQNGESVEEAGRRIRYDFFSSIDPDAKVATAHNLSDNAETLIFNLTRGSGLKGLCSIPPVRDKIIRPLIDISKKEILEYCETNDVPFMSDSTNDLDCYTRNKIRHNIIPVLEDINPSFLNSVKRLTQSLSEDEEYLNSEAEKLYNESITENGFSVVKLKNAPMSLRKRVVINILSKECSQMPTAKNIDAVLSILDKGGSTQVGDGIIFRIRKGILEKVDENNDISSWCIDFSEGTVNTPSGILKIHKKVYIPTQKVKKHLLADAIDCGKIIGNLKIRSRCAGDTFTSTIRKNTKSLKKLFNEVGIKPEDRNKIPIISDDEGILWIYSIGVSERAKCTSETKEAFFIETGDSSND